jgi:FixJ family two-component response regulator
LIFALDGRNFVAARSTSRAAEVSRMPEQVLSHGEAVDADGFERFRRVEALTPRERAVLAEIVAGASNKEAGRTLGISPRTVEVHRANIMEKLGAKNAADLVRIALGQGGRH